SGSAVRYCRKWCGVSTSPAAACSPWARPSGRTTFRNPRWRGLAYFLPCMPIQDNANNWRRASTTGRRSGLGLDGANLFHLRGKIPDIQKLLLTNVSRGEGKLHAGKDIAVGRDVAKRMARAARV